MDSPATIDDVFRDAARTSRGVRFLVSEEDAPFFPYTALFERARGFAGALRRAGLEPGDRVGIVLPTGPAFYDAFLGAILGGLVPVPLYPPVRLGRLADYHQRTVGMLTGCGARMLLTDRRCRRLLGETVRHAHLELGCHLVEAMTPEPGFAPVPATPADTALLQYSSGTTGEPRPVALTHAQVMANINGMREAVLKAFPEGPSLQHAGAAWLPLYHDMGLIGGLLWSLAFQVDIALIPPERFLARPAVWLRAISRYRATISGGPNFAFSLCCSRVTDDDLAGLDLSCWRVALNGAEPIAPDVLEAFTRKFAPYGLRKECVTPVYGLAEATVAVTFSHLERAFRVETFDRQRLLVDGVAERAAHGISLVALGHPLPGTRVQIRGDDGRLVPEGVVGAIEVSGPSLATACCPPRDDGDPAAAPGWLDTGDRGFLFDTELFVFGRARDIIILNGRNHAPQEFEGVVARVPGVRAGCCVAIGVVLDEVSGGEELVLLVEYARDTAPEPEALAREIAREVVAATGVVPGRVTLLAPGTLPRTSSGKLRRRQAARDYLAETLHPPVSMTPARLVFELARSMFHLRAANRERSA